MTAGRAFIDRSRSYLTGEYLLKIRRSVADLPEPDVWWRANAESNSVGNLILHLAGNVRQWVVSGIGGARDERDRQKEFDARAGSGTRELLDHLEAAVTDADRVLSGLSPDRLLERRVIQGREVTVLEAVYHVVEHFSMHTGQIIYITKLKTGVDLTLYKPPHDSARPQAKP